MRPPDGVGNKISFLQMENIFVKNIFGNEMWEEIAWSDFKN